MQHPPSTPRFLITILTLLGLSGLIYLSGFGTTMAQEFETALYQAPAFALLGMFLGTAINYILLLVALIYGLNYFDAWLRWKFFCAGKGSGNYSFPFGTGFFSLYKSLNTRRFPKAKLNAEEWHAAGAKFEHEDGMPVLTLPGAYKVNHRNGNIVLLRLPSNDDIYFVGSTFDPNRWIVEHLVVGRSCHFYVVHEEEFPHNHKTEAEKLYAQWCEKYLKKEPAKGWQYP